MSQSTNLSQMNTVATAPATKSTQIPDLLKIGAMPSDTSMDVLTDILDPVVHNDGYVRFAFQNKGILHSQSKLQLAVSGLDRKGVFPINCGVYNLIDRVRFSIGSKTVSEIDDFRFFMSYKSIFLSQEAMREREQYLTSRIMNFGFEYKDQINNVANEYMWGWAGSNPNNGVATGGTIAPGNSTADFITFDNGVEAGIPTQQDGVEGPAGTLQFMNKVATVGGKASATTGNGRPIYKFGYWNDLTRVSTETEPTFQLSLSDLVPFLKTQQIPLFMLDELVTLELFFTPVGERVIAPHRANPSAGTSCSIKQSETKMIADYLFYPNEMMVSYANANRNLQFNYADYRLSKYSLNDGAGKVPSGTLIRNIGGAGRMINRIFFSVSSADENTAGDLNTGRTGAFAPLRDVSHGATSNLNVEGQATINLKYNDNFIFPIDVKNNARHFHNTAAAEMVTPACITRQLFSGEGKGGLSIGSLQCASAQANFTGDPAKNSLLTLGAQFFFPALKLQPGERVNSRGIELYLEWSNSAVVTANGYIQRVWLETMKSLQLENGRVSITYA